MLLVVALRALFNFGKKSCVYIVKHRSAYGKYAVGCLPCLSGFFISKKLIHNAILLLVVILRVLFNFGKKSCIYIVKHRSAYGVREELAPPARKARYLFLFRHSEFRDSGMKNLRGSALNKVVRPHLDKFSLPRGGR